MQPSLPGFVSGHDFSRALKAHSRMGSSVCVRTLLAERLVQIRPYNKLFALYQGTTLVVL